MVSHYREKIGYLANVPPSKVVCVDNACLVTGSSEAMRQFVATVDPDLKNSVKILKTSFGDVLRALHGGGAYAFDKQAYSRFYPLARREGLDVKDVDFEDIKKQGFSFVTVRIEKKSL